MKKIHKDFIVFILLMLPVIFVIDFDWNYKCSWQRKFDNLELKGVVKRRFIDTKQHSSRIIEIKSIQTGVVDTINLFGDESNTFYVIKELDTLSKSRNSNEVFIKIDGVFKSVGIVDFGCEKE